MLGAQISHATHNRAGEITYVWVGPNTIEATITTCTKTSSPADRDFLELFWGDGTSDTLYRDNAAIIYFSAYDIQKNTYTGTHTYLGAGTFELCFVDPNRNDGIININGGSSVNESFSVKSSLTISTFCGGGSNNSVQFIECPCPELGCVNKPNYYIPGAYDPDGDSLSYELVICMADCGTAVTNYTIPSGMSIDPVTGILSWLVPTTAGEYNVAIKITEWRDGCNMGYVIRDLQITISNVCSNDPPDIEPINDTCVEAGTTLTFPVNTTDPNAGDVITVTGNGQPFIVPTNPAFMSGTTTGTSPLTSTFVWNTDCSHISSSPYQVYFIAEDDDPLVPLSDIESVFITVVAPAPTGLSIQPLGNTMQVSWNQGSCGDIIGYKIYRRVDSSMVAPDCCESGSMEALGFTLAGMTTSASDTDFVDTAPLVIGELYCYVVVACYDDGATSCPSAEVCAQLLHDVPVITHVSVVTTDVSNGVDSICWSKPTELDTILFPGPYHYKIYRTNGFTGAGALIAQTTPVTDWYLFNDTCFEDSAPGLNTQDSAYNYRVELFYTNPVGPTETLVGSTNTGSSIYLTLTPNDNQLGLTWQHDVPWNNTSYDVYRSTDGGFVYNYLATTSDMFYIDSGLVNGFTYCYEVKSTGAYSMPEIVNPIVNWSQRVCDAPWDFTPPCPPNLTVDADCDNEINSLWWNNPNNLCADDVVGYNLYYTPIEGGTPELIASFNSADDTTFSHANNGSIAGCYWITALDSAIYGNESALGDPVCVDNCPHYNLPNVFSPNGDGSNDFFVPFPYQYVDSIHIQIFNRWGNLLFQTDDPDIMWDGTAEQSGESVPEGIYYYTCTVYAITLQGLDPIDLNGYFHLFRGNTNFGQ